MATQGAYKIKDKIQQVIEELGQALDEWLNKQRPRPKPIPIPVDPPVRRK